MSVFVLIKQVIKFWALEEVSDGDLTSNILHLKKIKRKKS